MKFNESIEQRLCGRHKASLKMTDWKDKFILDVGCGNCWFEGNLTAQRVWFGINSYVISIDKKYDTGIENFKTTVKFNTVVMFDVLEHVDDVDRVLNKINSLLNPDGEFLLSVPYRHWTQIFDIAWYFGHRHYSVNQIYLLLVKHGFKIDKTEGKGGWYELIAMLLFYPFKWFFNMEIPFKRWFDRKRDNEYLGNKKGFSTLFVWGKKQ